MTYVMCIWRQEAARWLISKSANAEVARSNPTWSYNFCGDFIMKQEPNL